MKGYSAYHCDPKLATLSPKPAFLHFPIMLENLQSLIFSNPKLLSLCVQPRTSPFPSFVAVKGLVLFFFAEIRGQKRDNSLSSDLLGALGSCLRSIKPCVPVPKVKRRRFSILFSGECNGPSYFFSGCSMLYKCICLVAPESSLFFVFVFLAITFYIIFVIYIIHRNND